MTANTISIDRLTSLLVAIDLAREGVAALLQEAKDGTATPAEAAADITEIRQNLTAALS